MTQDLRAELFAQIEEPFTGELLFDYMAKAIQRIQSQFEQRIQKIFELTAGQFVKKMRMDAAMRKLKETPDPIVNIALDCGYSDQSTFTRQFKQVAGLSPAQYRRMVRE